ncbi:MAG: hypothetical protein ABWY11_20035, partial [Umezawaea sp.]
RQTLHLPNRVLPATTTNPLNTSPLTPPTNCPNGLNPSIPSNTTATNRRASPSPNRRSGASRMTGTTGTAPADRTDNRNARNCTDTVKLPA